MAYGDYGGYAYLNGIHIAERSDTSIKIDSTTEIDGHVVLGDGPIHIVLYKQYAIIYIKFARKYTIFSRVYESRKRNL